MIKDILKKTIRLSGYEVRKINDPLLQLPETRPVDNMKSLLEDLRRRGLNCSFIIDVGANRADWCRMAKRIFTEAKFCLIEPQAEMQGSLQAFCNEFEGSFFIAAGTPGHAGKLKPLPFGTTCLAHLFFLLLTKLL